MKLISRRALLPLWLFCLTSGLRAQEAFADRIVVSAARLPDLAAESPFAARVVAAEDLRRSSQLRLDDILRAQVPGFSLFRRSSSRVANPTTQGVTLRNFGPSGAGRTLVLLDGIPQNDPFAGYVLWNELPAALIDDVIVQPGGGAGLYGNAALAGTIFITSRAEEQTSARAEALVGNAHTSAADLFASFVDKPAAASLFAEHFSTGGYAVLQRDQRGKVDRDATSDSDLLQLTAEYALTRDASLQVRARGFNEERGNGTAYTRNATRGEDLSLGLTSQFPKTSAELRLNAYYQHRNFSSTFSSINATRDVETPALNQFRVPADAAGGSAVWAMALGEQNSLAVGSDVRWAEGETNELFRFIGKDFTRLRVAGGEQLFVGIFAEDKWKVSDRATIVGGVRLDHWRLFAGARDEFDRSTGAATLRSPFPDRDGYTVNGRLGTSVSLTNAIALRAAGYTGFRVPTLNELYRPFRVGNVTTDANPALDPERLYGGEAAVEWRPVQALKLAGTFFYNRLEDAVGNITISTSPGGAVLRQRQNIALVTAPGAELSAQWQIATPLFLRASYLWTDPTIERASDAALVGRLLAQTPQHVAVGAVEYHPASRWLVTAQIRYNGRQFEDDQNALALAPFITIDAAVFYDATDRFSAGVKAENLFDADIETGKTPDGLVSIGAPRLVTVEVRWRL